MSATTGSTNNNAQLAPAKKKNTKQYLTIGILIAVVLIGTIFGVAYQRTIAFRLDIEDGVHQLQKNLLSSRALIIENWIKDSIAKGSLLAKSEFFQLFASEVDKIGAIPALFSQAKEAENQDFYAEGSTPAARLPLMRIQLTEFVAYANFVSATIVNSKAEAYLTTNTSLPSLSEVQKEHVRKVMESNQVVFGSIYRYADGLAINIYMPIMPPNYERSSGKPASVLVLTQQVSVKLNELLTISETDNYADLRLVQENADVLEEVLTKTLDIRPVSSDITESVQQGFTFDMRNSLGGAAPVYSSGVRLGIINAWLVAENEASKITAQYHDFAKTAYSIAALASVALLLLISASWWWIVGREQTQVNEHFKELLEVIHEQKKLLDGINDTISDPIALTDTKGVYKYVNKAFAHAVGREEKDVIGLDSPAVFGFDTARRLNATDQHVLMTGESVTVTEVLYLQSQRYHFQISKTPLRDPSINANQGIVSVYRDITKVVETEEKSRRVVQQTIDALVQTIEQADPFLGGHSRIMGQVAGLISKQLRLSDPDTATIAAAANLSQIGKMFVPREVLLKPGILTPEEKLQMERHVEHAYNALKGIEFDLPVLDAICQMNETLNGKGYPNGLTEDQISMHAKVLAIANVFTAMARPRAYRPAVPVSDILQMLAEQKDRYDQKIVMALKQAMETPEGEKIVTRAASSQSS